MKIRAIHCMMAAASGKMMMPNHGTGEISLRLNDLTSSPISCNRGCRSILVIHPRLPRCGSWIQVEVIMAVAGEVSDFGDRSVCVVDVVVVDGYLRCVPLILLPYFQGSIRID